MKFYAFALWLKASEYEWLYVGLFDRKSDALKRARQEVRETGVLGYQIDTHIIERKENRDAE